MSMGIDFPGGPNFKVQNFTFIMARIWTKKMLDQKSLNNDIIHKLP